MLFLSDNAFLPVESITLFNNKIAYEVKVCEILYETYSVYMNFAMKKLYCFFFYEYIYTKQRFFKTYIIWNLYLRKKGMWIVTYDFFKPKSLSRSFKYTNQKFQRFSSSSFISYALKIKTKRNMMSKMGVYIKHFTVFSTFNIKTVFCV